MKYHVTPEPKVAKGKRRYEQVYQSGLAGPRPDYVCAMCFWRSDYVCDGHAFELRVARLVRHGPIYAETHWEGISVRGASLKVIRSETTSGAVRLT